MSSEDAPATEAITFTVKSSNDAKYTVSIASHASVAELKIKLAEVADVPVERQRLIYSGRVLKNEETLDFYKVKSGNTVHMVKSAASTASTQGSSAGPASSGVPNMASGTANNPLAGLTGARYAGQVQLPGAEMFGADGGMGAPPNPEMFAEAMNNPMVRSQVNEMLSNPQLLDMIIQSNPMLQSMGPQARELMQSDMFRQMVTNPDIFRQLGGGAFQGMGGMGAASSFPAPGTTNTTPPTGENDQDQQRPTEGTSTQQPPANPFVSLFGQGGAAVGANAANPFMNPALLAGLMNPGASGATPRAGAEGASSGSTGVPGVPNMAAMQQMLAAMQGQGGGDLFGLGGLGGGAPATPTDNRPPEERYADQLRQLNDMGFFDFDANVAALRRSGGSVQGAVNQLLGG